MKTGDEGINLIKLSEGLRLDAYQDQGGIWTVGYGHITGVHEGVHITEEQADMLLQADLEHVENALNRLVPSTCTQNQFDALADFAFNLGTSALETLLSHGWEEVPSQLPRWNHVAGKVSNGLSVRRSREVELFNRE